jgi:hypothetical protein
MGTLLLGVSAVAEDSDMSCADVLAKMRLEATPEALERFKDLEGSCMGVVERDGELFMTTKMVVRNVTGNNVTLYLPATDRTFRVRAEAGKRFMIGNTRVRARDLNRGQELHLYVSVAEFTQPVIEKIAFATESEEIIIAPVVVVAAMPTTG